MLTSEFLNMRLELLRGDYDKIKTSMQNLKVLLLREKQYTLLNTLDVCQMFIASSLNRPQDTPE